MEATVYIKDCPAISSGYILLCELTGCIACRKQEELLHRQMEHPQRRTVVCRNCGRSNLRSSWYFNVDVFKVITETETFKMVASNWLVNQWLQMLSTMLFVFKKLKQP
ncbi:hypothetical protein CsSME_00044939 [Camellia sinensis var. sinensis]